MLITIEFMLEFMVELNEVTQGITLDGAGTSRTQTKCLLNDSTWLLRGSLHAALLSFLPSF
jgi:hypothetical protein